jgi:hypothetical protein
MIEYDISFDLFQKNLAGIFVTAASSVVQRFVQQPPHLHTVELVAASNRSKKGIRYIEKLHGTQ